MALHGLNKALLTRFSLAVKQLACVCILYRPGTARRDRTAWEERRDRTAGLAGGSRGEGEEGKEGEAGD